MNYFDFLRDDDEVEVKKTTPTGTTTTGAKKVVTKEQKPEKVVSKIESNGKRQVSSRVPKKDNVEGSTESNTQGGQKRDSKTYNKHQVRLDASGKPRNRQFDRHSGTGRPIMGENKREGGGKFNTGKAGEVYESEPVEKEENANNTTQSTTATANTTTQQTTPPVEEDKNVSFVEYLKQQQKEAVTLDAPKIRVAGEGVENSQWTDYEPIKKEGPVKTSNKKSVKESNKGSKKNIIQVGTKSQPQNKSRSNRGPQNEKKQPTVNEKEFPSLPKAEKSN